MRLIKPDWPAPDNIIAFSSTRKGGVSEGVYQGLNIAHHVGDMSDAVAQNRDILSNELPPDYSIVWLNQEHGTRVVRARNSNDTLCADGSWTDVPGVVSAVMTADCLPVLLCSQSGEFVASAHAGWRGLQQGILEACVAAMPVEGSQLMAWLGPAIGPDAFEVGGEVRQQFLSSAASSLRDRVAQCFKEQPGKQGFFLADLYALARIRLNAAGVLDIYGGEHCTFSTPDLFYSYRRDGKTGRMATMIAKVPT